MAKKNSRNTDILKDSKDTTSPKVYSILVNLVNNNREDLAEDVLKIDYLLDYTNRCIKAKDIKEANETIKIAQNRMNKIKEFGFEIDYLDYIYEGIKSKLK